MLTFEQIKELVELVSGHGLNGLEIERSGFRLRIDGRSVSPAAAEGAELAPAPARAPAVAAREVREASPAPAEASLGEAASGGGAGAAADAHILNSPIVGTFYAASSPDTPPFAAVGDRVRKGQVVCIVEAMKLMNEIESDVDGVVVAIYPKNAQPVEFGEPLFAIRQA